MSGNTILREDSDYKQLPHSWILPRQDSKYQQLFHRNRSEEELPLNLEDKKLVDDAVSGRLEGKNFSDLLEHMNAVDEARQYWCLEGRLGALRQSAHASGLSCN